jgi:hypothetical protein
MFFGTAGDRPIAGRWSVVFAADQLPDGLAADANGKAAMADAVAPNLSAEPPVRDVVGGGGITDPGAPSFVPGN